MDSSRMKEDQTLNCGAGWKQRQASQAEEPSNGMYQLLGKVSWFYVFMKNFKKEKQQGRGVGFNCKEYRFQ